MSRHDSIQALMELGFTELEAEVYACLLEESPATGYRVAQVTGRLPGNVYKALESLQAKGAVLVDEGASRMARAVPANELLAMLRRRYQDRETRAAKALSELKETEEDDRVYQIRSYDQLIERARAMLTRCKVVAVIDIYPEPLEVLREDIAEVAKRAEVTLKTYLPDKVEGAFMVPTPRGQESMALYPGQWLVMSIDGQEVLIASLAETRPEVHQALWSRSPVLAYMMHTTLTGEMMLCSLFQHIDAGTPTEEMQGAIQRFTRSEISPSPAPPVMPVLEVLQRYGKLYSRGVPGHEALWERFGENRKPPSPPSERRE